MSTSTPDSILDCGFSIASLSDNRASDLAFSSKTSMDGRIVDSRNHRQGRKKKESFSNFRSPSKLLRMLNQK